MFIGKKNTQSGMISPNMETRRICLTLSISDRDWVGFDIGTHFPTLKHVGRSRPETSHEGRTSVLQIKGQAGIGDQTGDQFVTHGRRRCQNAARRLGTVQRQTDGALRQHF